LNRAITEPEKFSYMPGRGIKALVDGELVLVGSRRFMKDHGVAIPIDYHHGHQGVSEIFISKSGRFYGVITIADTVRPEAQRAVGKIRRMGLQIILLTGDNQTIAEVVGRELTIHEVEADLLPEDKLARVRNLVASGRTVLMLGDGINDAPALTEASVGVAMGSGTDVARESSDVVLIGNDFAKFTDVLIIAQRTRAIIWQNFYGTIAVDGLGIGLAAIGFLNPLVAAFIHVASELAFILNSARLLPHADLGTTKTANL
jgi:Cd2+/Zn2+-exporting ATPase/Cu+-exporting ATPase